MDLIISTSNPRAKHKDFNLWLWFFAFKEMPSVSSRITFLARHFQAEAADLPPARAVADGSMSSGPPDPAAQFPFLRHFQYPVQSRVHLKSAGLCSVWGDAYGCSREGHPVALQLEVMLVRRRQCLPRQPFPVTREQLLWFFLLFFLPWTLLIADTDF